MDVRFLGHACFTLSDTALFSDLQYNTFAPIETDAEAFKVDVESATSANVVVLEPGDRHAA